MGMNRSATICRSQNGRPAGGLLNVCGLSPSVSCQVPSSVQGRHVLPRRLLACWLALLPLLIVVPSRADLALTMNSPTITQGGTGTLDVFLTSNASPSAPDLLNNLAFTLQIMGPNELQFSSSQSFAYLSNGQYVFAGDSTDQATASDGGSLLTTVYKNDTFIGNDSTFSFDSISLSSANSPVLLAALTLDAAITAAGDSYTINLVPSGGNGSMTTNANTFFDVTDFNDTGLETSAVPFSSTSGTVTVSEVTAVPEPASDVIALTTLLAGAGAIGARKLRRRE